MYEKLSDQDMIYMLSHKSEIIYELNDGISSLYRYIESILSDSDSYIVQSTFRSPVSGGDIRVQTSNLSDLSDILYSIKKLQLSEIRDVQQYISKKKQKKEQLHRLCISYDILQESRQKKIFGCFLKASKKRTNVEVLVAEEGVSLRQAYDIRKAVISLINAIYLSEASTFSLLQMSPMGAEQIQDKFLNCKKGVPHEKKHI